MKKPTLIAALYLMLEIALTSTALAHQVSAQHEETCTAGAYQLTIGYYSWPVHAEEAADVLLTPQSVRYQRRELGISAVLLPAATTAEAQQGFKRVEKVVSDPDSYGSYGFSIQPPSRGEWLLSITVRGPEGDGNCVLTILVAGPPEIPYWLGWLIALGPPLAGIGWFAWWQRRQVRNAV